MTTGRINQISTTVSPRNHPDSPSLSLYNSAYSRPTPVFTLSTIQTSTTFKKIFADTQRSTPAKPKFGPINRQDVCSLSIGKSSSNRAQTLRPDFFLAALSSPVINLNIRFDRIFARVTPSPYIGYLGWRDPRALSFFLKFGVFEKFKVLDYSTRRDKHEYQLFFLKKFFFIPQKFDQKNFFQFFPHNFSKNFSISLKPMSNILFFYAEYDKKKIYGQSSKIKIFFFWNFP